MTKRKWIALTFTLTAMTLLLCILATYLVGYQIGSQIRSQELPAAPAETPAPATATDDDGIPPIVLVVVGPTVPAETPASTPADVTQPPTVEQAVASSCHLINDYNLEWDMDHVSTSGSHLHVEYWWEGQPEKEVLLPTAGVAGGRYNLTRSLRGHVWEYVDCTDAEVMEQINAHITRRREGGANNKGYVAWERTGLFQPVH